MGERCALSVVLPAYREGASLQALLPKLSVALAPFVASFEVLVVDTCEPLDDTRDVCLRFGAAHIRRANGDGYGDAVRTGIAHARGEFVLFMDADGSHDPIAIGEMWERRHRHDVVIGSRYVPGGRSENGPLLVAMSRLLGLAFRLTFHMPVADATTSFRLYHGDTLRRLELHADGFDILQEMLLGMLAGPGRTRVTEIPVTFRRRTAGTSKRNLRTLAVAYLTTYYKLKRHRTTASVISSP